MRNELTRVQAAQHLQEKWGMRCSGDHLANLAAGSGGPRYVRRSGHAFYAPTDLDDYARSKLGPLIDTVRNTLNNQHARRAHQ
jgi:hypothetical protein